MKVLCPHCERLVELERFCVEDGVLHVTCGRCGADTPVPPPVPSPSAAPEVAQPAVDASVLQARHLPAGASLASGATSPAPARAPETSPSRPPSQPPRVSLASSPSASNVVTLRTATADAIERAAASAEHNPFEVPPGFCPKCVARRDGGAACPQCGLAFDTFVAADVEPPAWLREAWVALLRAWGDDAAHEALRQRAHQEDMLGALGRLYRLRLAVEPNDPIAEKGRNEVLRLATAAMGSLSRGDAAVAPQRMKTVLTGVAVLFAVGAVGLLIRLLVQRAP